MREEWAVGIVNGRMQDETERRDMVAIGEVSSFAGESVVIICDDDAEANRIAEVVATQTGLPMYDGADPFPDAGDASAYVDVDADGPDPYADLRNAAQVR